MYYIHPSPVTLLAPDEVDNGQCARLVQVKLQAPQAKFWRRGPQVQANPDIPSGIAIATFELGGTFDEMQICGNVQYTNRSDHTAHAAVYLEQDASGIWVIDQWKGRGKVAKSYYRFTPTDSVPIHDGKKYYVIDGPPYLNQRLSRYSSEVA
jgi:hypothetical protein